MSTDRKNLALGGHQSARAKSQDWLTPPAIIKRLGTFDLDPCCPSVMPWKTAAIHYCRELNGLSHNWHGRVWLNPPFDNSEPWLRRMAQHGNGIALLAARTETELYFEHVWPVATSILFLKSRPHFHFPNGQRAPFNSGAPICLIAFGGGINDQALKASKLGKWIRLRQIRDVQ